MAQVSSNLSVLLFEEEGIWSAQCLEIDLAAQANSLKDIYYEFMRTVVSHVAVCNAHGKDPFKDAGPAPGEYWKMFSDAKLHIAGDRVPFAPPGMPFDPDFRLADLADRSAA